MSDVANANLQAKILGDPVPTGPPIAHGIAVTIAPRQIPRRRRRLPGRPVRVNDRTHYGAGAWTWSRRRPPAPASAGWPATAPDRAPSEPHGCGAGRWRPPPPRPPPRRPPARSPEAPAPAAPAAPAPRRRPAGSTGSIRHITYLNAACPARNSAGPPRISHASGPRAVDDGAVEHLLVARRGDDDPGHHHRVDEVVGGPAQPAGVVEALMTSVLASAERSKYSHHSATEPANATMNAAIEVRGGVLHPGQGGADDDDRLAQRDQDERLAALGEVTALDRPVGRARPAETGGREPDDAAEHVHPDRQQPQQLPGVAAHQPARHRQRPAGDAPDQDPREVVAQRAGRQRGHHEDGAPDLHERVRAADPDARRSPNARGSAADIARLTSISSTSSSRTAIRSGSSQFVTQVVYIQASQTIASRIAVWSGAPERRRREQIVRELRDREHVDQVEEQLDVGDPLVSRPVAQQPGRGLGPGALTRRSAPARA